jgi:hypothetical protein
MNRTVYVTPYQPHLAPKKYPGTYTIVGNNLRVSNALGVNSVKFDDIVSISVKNIKAANGKYFGKLLLRGVLISIIVFILFFSKSPAIAIVGSTWFFLAYGFITFIVTHAFMYNHISWENVLIETTGGGILFFSVEKDQGINEVNRLELLRNNQLSI